MSKLISLVKYQLHIYLKGSRFVMPLVAAFLFLSAMYSVKPLNIVSSFLISGVFLFLLMVWIGLSLANAENPVLEQLILLRVQNEGIYYLSKYIYILIIGLFADLFCILFPVIMNILNGGDMFLRSLTINDCVNGFLLQGGCIFVGAGLGSLLHPRVMKDRRMAIVLTVFFAILTLVKTALAEEIVFMKWIVWSFPPIMNAAEQYGNAEQFRLNQSITLFIYMVLYGSMLCAIKSYLCHRNKF